MARTASTIRSDTPGISPPFCASATDDRMARVKRVCPATLRQFSVCLSPGWCSTFPTFSPADGLFVGISRFVDEEIMLALTATVKAVISRLRNYVVLRLLLPVLFWELYKAGVKNLQHSPPQEPCSHLDSSIRRRKSSTTSTQASRICVTIRNPPAKPPDIH